MEESELAFVRELGSDPMPSYLAKEGALTGYGRTEKEAIANLEAGQRHMAAMRRVN